MSVILTNAYYNVEYDIYSGKVRGNIIRCKKGETGRGIHVTIINDNKPESIDGITVRLRYLGSDGFYYKEPSTVANNGFNIPLDNVLKVTNFNFIETDIEVTISGKTFSSNILRVYFE